MPSVAHSRAAVRVSARIASFDALYAAKPRAAGDAHRRREVDDAAPLLSLHVRVHRLHRPQRSLDARRVEHVDVVFVDVGDRRERPERLRVVDEPVDATEALDRLRDHRVDLVVLLDVAHDAEVLDAERRRARRTSPRAGAASTPRRRRARRPCPRCSAMPLPTPRPEPVTMITLPVDRVHLARASYVRTCGARRTAARTLDDVHDARRNGRRHRRRQRHRPGDRATRGPRRRARSPSSTAHAENAAATRPALDRRRRAAPTRATSATTARSAATVAATGADLGRVTGVVTAAGIFHGPDLQPAHQVDGRRLRPRAARQPRRHVRGDQVRAADARSTAAARSSRSRRRPRFAVTVTARATPRAKAASTR